MKSDQVSSYNDAAFLRLTIPKSIFILQDVSAYLITLYETGLIRNAMTQYYSSQTSLPPCVSLQECRGLTVSGLI